MITIERKDGQEVCGRICLPEGHALWSLVVGETSSVLEFYAPQGRNSDAERRVLRAVKRKERDLGLAIVHAVAQQYPEVFGGRYAAF